MTFLTQPQLCHHASTENNIRTIFSYFVTARYDADMVLESDSQIVHCLMKFVPAQYSRYDKAIKCCIKLGQYDQMNAWVHNIIILIKTQICSQ